MSQALERYFGARDQQDRINQKSASMVKLLKGQIERCEKKLAQQEEDLSSAARMDEYRIMGEIINANLWQLKKGQTEATLPNFYDENGGSMTIPLDNQLTPVQNAQRYFKKYQKMCIRDSRLYMLVVLAVVIIRVLQVTPNKWTNLLDRMTEPLLSPIRAQLNKHLPESWNAVDLSPLVLLLLVWLVRAILL